MPRKEAFENDTRVRSVYAIGWAVHQLLQLYQQSFLFDNQSSYRLTLAAVLLVLLFPRHRIIFLNALIVRNVARARRCPFLWDSEFWLALTDLSAILSILLSVYYHRHNHTRQRGFFVNRTLPWIRVQLAIQYAACALFKLNTAFLRVDTSCAPIFVLSLLVKTLPPTTITSLPDWMLSLTARIAPWSVVLVEFLIAAFLAFDGRLNDIGIGLALIFHALIAVTPPPNGVPTFSCVAISRLFLLIGNSKDELAPAVRIIFSRGLGRAAVIAVAVAAVALQLTQDAAVVLYFSWASLCVLAMWESAESKKRAVGENINGHTGTKATPALIKWTGRFLVGLAAFYAIVPPILGLQEIGSNTMFANLRLHGGTNHIWGIPSGLMQQWRYQGTDDADESGDSGHYHSGWTDAFGGGVVRVEFTNSAHLNRLYPGEMTSWLSPDLRFLLERVGHVGRQFNPKARRVLGPAARESMPRWEPELLSNTTWTASFVKYTVPALEFRRLLQEARAHAHTVNQTFEIAYTRLDGTVGDEEWRRRSKGVTVRIRNDDGNGKFDCISRNDRKEDSNWEPCESHELALLPTPSWWATKFMLFYPYAIPTEDEKFSHGNQADELLCNY